MLAGILYAGFLGTAIRTEYLKSQQMEFRKHAKARHYGIMEKASAWE